jgi:hypothetical protein
LCDKGFTTFAAFSHMCVQCGYDGCRKSHPIARHPSPRIAAMHFQNNRLRRRELHPATATCHQACAMLPSLAITKVSWGRVTVPHVTRTARPRLALVGMPLAMVAALMSGQWWAPIPLAACAWWWAPTDWGWYWLVALLRGALGFAWASTGASALAAWPDLRPVTAAVWCGSVALLVASRASMNGA